MAEDIKRQRHPDTTNCACLRYIAPEPLESNDPTKVWYGAKTLFSYMDRMLTKKGTPRMPIK